MMIVDFDGKKISCVLRWNNGKFHSLGLLGCYDICIENKI